LKATISGKQGNSMEVVIIDILDGNSGNLNMRKGWTFDRQATVTGVIGNGYEKIINAANADGMPEMGSPHPHPDLYNVLLQDKQCTSISNDIVTLTLKYRAPDVFIPTGDDVVINVGSSLSQTETNLDANGNVLFTSYTYPADYERNVQMRGVTEDQPGIISKLIPQTTQQYVRLEEDSPLALSNTYVGAINSVFFAGGAPKTWMCTGITGNSVDGGDTWSVTYSFQFKVDTWDTQLIYINPDTSKPPPFLTPAAIAAGVKSYQIYPLLDFNQLGL